MPQAIREFLRGSTEDFVPQAIFSLPMSYFSRWTDFIYEDFDDLDDFVGALFKLNNGTDVEIKRYSGFPRDLVSMYLSPAIDDVRTITSLVSMAAEEFHIPAGNIVWQRQDGLDPPILS